VVAFYDIGIVRVLVPAYGASNLVDSVDLRCSVREIGKEDLTCLTTCADVHEIPVAGIKTVHY
jgi:hypothetical protein